MVNTPKTKPINRLEEETKLSPADLRFKVKKLESYMKRAERRITTLERKLARVEESARSQGNLLKKVLA